MEGCRNGGVRANEVEFQDHEAGLVPCAHGFPDSPWTWCHLLPALAGVLEFLPRA